jgi:hypothetical protein
MPVTALLENSTIGVSIQRSRPLIFPSLSDVMERMLGTVGYVEMQENAH